MLHGDIAVGYLGGGQAPKKANLFWYPNREGRNHPFGMKSLFAERYLGGGFRYLLFLCLFWEIIQFDEYFSKGVETIGIFIMVPRKIACETLFATLLLKPGIDTSSVGMA